MLTTTGASIAFSNEKYPYCKHVKYIKDRDITKYKPIQIRKTTIRFMWKNHTTLIPYFLVSIKLTPLTLILLYFCFHVKIWKRRLLFFIVLHQCSMLTENSYPIFEISGNCACVWGIFDNSYTCFSQSLLHSYVWYERFVGNFCQLVELWNK